MITSVCEKILTSVCENYLVNRILITDKIHLRTHVPDTETMRKYFFYVFKVLTTFFLHSSQFFFITFLMKKIY